MPRSAPRQVTRATALVACVTFCLLAAMASYLADAATGSPTTANCFAASIGVLGCVTFTAVRLGVWSASGAYLIVFWLFHFGLAAALGLRLITLDDLSGWDRAWFSSPHAAPALWLATSGAFGILAGVFAARSVVGSMRSGKSAVGSHGLARLHTLGGVLLVCASIVVWGGIVLAGGGLSAFWGSYEEYLQQTRPYETAMALVWQCLGVGIVLLAAGPSGAGRRVGVAVLLLFVCVALPLGLRGELLFPAVAAMVMAARSGKTMPTWRLYAAAAAILLVLIPVVREVRTVGLRSIGEARVELRLSDGLVEVGGSLHPVEKVVRWRAEGEPFLFGASYWAPIERAAARLLPDLTSVRAEDDSRIMNILVMDRVGPIGFSPVAEAYRNFGSYGVPAILLVIGLLIGLIDAVPNERRAILLTAALYVPLLINIRNSFIAVPAQAIAGAAIVAITSLLWHLGRAGRPLRTRAVIPDRHIARAQADIRTEA